jgi:hypothetical protein
VVTIAIEVDDGLGCRVGRDPAGDREACARRLGGGVIRRNQAARRRRLGIALAAAVLLASGHLSPRTAGAAATGGKALTNWASDVVTETASASGRDPVEANRVTLTVAGGPVVVQWSLSYTGQITQLPLGSGRSASVVRIQTLASLERDGTELARWTLADQTEDLSLPTAQGWIAGTASGLFVDHASGSGRRTYVLKAWNSGAGISVSTRTMICEER